MLKAKPSVDNNTNKVLNVAMDNFKRAIDAAGSQTELARRLGLLPQYVNNWKSRGVPADRCPAIEAITGVRCEELRPDLSWNRDADGTVTGYTVKVATPEVRDAA